ncbi:MAG: hypothetical protein WAU47_10155 [Desulfobaccales bacterium]
MPKPKAHADKEKDLKKFIQLTWGVVRRNKIYKENYVRFLQNYGLTPEGVKPIKKENGSSIIPWHPARSKSVDFDFEKGRWPWDAEEQPDPERCNLSYMMHTWGFACDPDEPNPQGSDWIGNFTSKEALKLRKHKPFNIQPLMDVQIHFKRLPGVLPEVRLKTPPGQTLLETLHGSEYKWEKEVPTQLTVTFNLQAPSNIIIYALEFLIF